jgi:hypothetical protein
MQASAYEVQVQQAHVQVQKFGTLQAKLPILKQQLQSTELEMKDLKDQVQNHGLQPCAFSASCSMAFRRIILGP